MFISYSAWTHCSVKEVTVNCRVRQNGLFDFSNRINLILSQSHNPSKTNVALQHSHRNNENTQDRNGELWHPWYSEYTRFMMQTRRSGLSITGGRSRTSGVLNDRPLGCNLNQLEKNIHLKKIKLDDSIYETLS